jgi:hypothetical protein
MTPWTATVTDADAQRTTLIDRLRELVAALDQRIPQIAREGERGIAHDSASLKAQAQQRIAELERQR